MTSHWNNLRALMMALGVALSGLTSMAQERGKNLFGLTRKTPVAAKGQFVLCPSRPFVDQALKKGADKATFIYYAAAMMEPGPQESVVMNRAGGKFSVPNELVIPIASGQRADVGDVVLTWWQSGSGMQRAIVIGGAPTQPVVRYLDIAYDNPSGAGKKDETLRANSFVVLRKPGQIGTSVAVRTSRGQRVGQLVYADERKILIREFAGRLRSYDKSLAEAIPINPGQLMMGDAAQVALFGSLRPVTVQRVDRRIGRVFATYQIGRTERQKAFPFGEVIAKRTVAASQPRRESATGKRAAVGPAINKTAKVRLSEADEAFVKTALSSEQTVYKALKQAYAENVARQKAVDAARNALQQSGKQHLLPVYMRRSTLTQRSSKPAAAAVKSSGGTTRTSGEPTSGVKASGGFEGTWQATRTVVAGKEPFPASTLAKISLRLKDGQYETRMNSFVETGTFTIDKSVSPARLTMTPSTGALKGKPRKGIFKVSADGAQLTTVFANAGPRPTAFKADAATTMMAIYKRAR